MGVRRALAFSCCLVLWVVTAPGIGAEPSPAPASPDAAAPVDGRVPSSPPATITTPDGWTLALGAKDEMQVPVAPLTTAISSREYVSSGIFVASLNGPEPPKGSLEVGFQIGCGIDMSTSNGVTMGGNAGVAPGVTPTFDVTGTLPPVLPFVTTPVNGLMTVGLKPGLIIVVPVVKKQFKGPNPWVMISNFHVKIDGCVAQSYIRSYATLTRVTDQSDVVLSYIGTTKAV